MENYQKIRPYQGRIRVARLDFKMAYVCDLSEIMRKYEKNI